MLPAALLRRPGLGRLVRQARAYAEAAAAPAPAAGPGQMSFTFASPTQVRTPFRTPVQARNSSPPFRTRFLHPPGRRSPFGIRSPKPQPPGRRPLFRTMDPCPFTVWSGVLPPPNARTFHLEFDAQGLDLPFRPGWPLAASTSPEISTSSYPTASLC